MKMEKLKDIEDLPILFLFSKKVYFDNIKDDILNLNVVNVECYGTDNYHVQSFYKPISKMFSELIIENTPQLNVL